MYLLFQIDPSVFFFFSNVSSISDGVFSFSSNVSSVSERSKWLFTLDNVQWVTDHTVWLYPGVKLLIKNWLVAISSKPQNSCAYMLLAKQNWCQVLSGAGWNRRGNFGELHIRSRGELKISIAQFCASKSLALKSPQFHSLTVPNPGSKVLTLIGFGAKNDPFLDFTIFELSFCRECCLP